MSDDNQWVKQMAYAEIVNDINTIGNPKTGKYLTWEEAAAALAKSLEEQKVK